MNLHPFRQPLVFIATPAGLLHLVTDPDDCTVCQQRGEVQIWNPTIHDGLTHELTPPAHRIWKIPCPVCRPETFARWEAPQ
ncbi:hypothetical protein SAMN05444365_102284 [Micromonospora pattaloongensis]|uniref:Uncharacterized protein n=1 Tax=Micromonospora pattaloongensis TaxID=405436 RepID=A0A1H3JX88_9ACTN|nr:hypothetical protein [Micromonospora pattaloongensis]SDY44553.1 hypothetical protein SAMN05444365_102284 [Micromonospora pattaloongensis]